MQNHHKQQVSERGRVAWDEYRTGLGLFAKQRWKSAARHFGEAERRAARSDRNSQLYASYYGLALIRCGDISGLNFCRHAASAERKNATVFLNLTRAELSFSHRRRACNAVNAGLALEPWQAELLEIRKVMGVRRPPLLSFLKRENLLNKWLGMITYRSYSHR